MTVSLTPEATLGGDGQAARVRMARIVGLAYLGLALTGALGNMVIRGKLYAAGDAARTVENLVNREGLARFGVAVDLAAVIAQALAAWFFFALFRRVHSTTAAAVAGFGLVGAAAMLVGVAFSATALEVAVDRSTVAASTPELLYHLQDSAWQVAGLFFGLWLIPIGLLVLRSGWMPPPLGWLLVAGGAGYVLNPFASYLLPNASALADVLLIPSTVGEIWMIVYLLVKGCRPAAVVEPPALG